MSETKWTPGPWPLETVETSVGSCHKIGAFPSAGVRKQVPACVYADRLRPGLDDRNPIAVELLANARLIAAAPELYEALEHCENLLMRYEINRVDGGAIADEALTKIRAALAKARGES